MTAANSMKPNTLRNAFDTTIATTTPPTTVTKISRLNPVSALSHDPSFNWFNEPRITCVPRATLPIHVAFMAIGRHVSRGGRMGGRRAVIVPKCVLEGWCCIVRDAFGELRIRTADGFDPLRHPDPLIRLRHTRRMAKAEALAYALGRAAVRALDQAGDDPEERDFACWLFAVLYESVPLAEEEAGVARRQASIYFEEAA